MIIQLIFMILETKIQCFSVLPTIGFNPDDGIKIGIITNYAINHFNQIHIGNTH
jgi:hypothetical protein